MLALSAIQNDDKRLEATVDANRVEHERQLTDVLHMLLALKVGSPPELTPTPVKERPLLPFPKYFLGSLPSACGELLQSNPCFRFQRDLHLSSDYLNQSIQVLLCFKRFAFQLVSTCSVRSTRARKEVVRLYLSQRDETHVAGLPLFRCGTVFAVVMVALLQLPTTRVHSGVRE